MILNTGVRLASFSKIPSFGHSLASQQVRHATKKSGGSSSNGRDSAGRRLGVKIFSGFGAKPGAIIIRQRGKKFHAGENVGMGKDHTIFSKIHGTVYMTKNHKKSNVVHVQPFTPFEEHAMQHVSL